MEKGGSEELDASRGARVEAGQSGGSGKPVVDGVGVHAQCMGGTASIEIAVEEGCTRRGQFRMAIKRLQNRCRFGGAVRGAGDAVVERGVLELVHAGPSGECRNEVGAFGCGRYVARSGGGCGADDRGLPRPGGQTPRDVLWVRILSRGRGTSGEAPTRLGGGLVQWRRGRSCCPSRAQRLLDIATVKLTFLPLW